MNDLFGHLFSTALLALKQNVYAVSLLLKAELHAQALVIARVSYESGMRTHWAAVTTKGPERLAMAQSTEKLHAIDLALKLDQLTETDRADAASSIEFFNALNARLGLDDSVRGLPDMRAIVQALHRLPLPARIPGYEPLDPAYQYGAAYSLPSAATHGDPAPYLTSPDPEMKRLICAMVFDGCLGGVQAFHHRYGTETTGLVDEIERVFDRP